MQLRLALLLLERCLLSHFVGTICHLPVSLCTSADYLASSVENINAASTPFLKLD